MLNYVSEQKKINAYFNKKVREVKKAERIFNESGWYWIDKPTERQRAAAVRRIEKQRTEMLLELEACAAADKLDFIKIKVEWSKSRTWGYNPRADVWTTGGYYATGRASRCGYDKESAAIGEALAGSRSLQRFLIENKIEAYGVESGFGIKHLSISGKGVGELLRLFRGRKGWSVTEMHRSNFDGYEIRRG